MANIQANKGLRQQICDMRPQLYRTAYAWSHSAALADDLAQDAIIKALSRLGMLKDRGALKTWVFRILTNCYRDWYRSYQEHVDIEVLELSCSDCPEEYADQDRTIHRVRCAMAQLSEDHRQAIALVDIEGFTYIEAGEALGIPMGTVMSRLSRGRSHRRRLLKTVESGPLREDGVGAGHRSTAA